MTQRSKTAHTFCSTIEAGSHAVPRMSSRRRAHRSNRGLPGAEESPCIAPNSIRDTQTCPATARGRKKRASRCPVRRQETRSGGLCGASGAVVELLFDRLVFVGAIVFRAPRLQAVNLRANALGPFDLSFFFVGRFIWHKTSEPAPRSKQRSSAVCYFSPFTYSRRDFARAAPVSANGVAPAPAPARAAAARGLVR